LKLRLRNFWKPCQVKAVLSESLLQPIRRKYRKRTQDKITFHSYLNYLPKGNYTIKRNISIKN